MNHKSKYSQSPSAAMLADSYHKHPAWQQDRSAMPDKIQLPGSLQDRLPAWRRPTLLEQISQPSVRCQRNRFAGDQHPWYNASRKSMTAMRWPCGPEWPDGPKWPTMESVVHCPWNHRFISAPREQLIPLKKFVHTIRRTTTDCRYTQEYYYIQ